MPISTETFEHIWAADQQWNISVGWKHFIVSKKGTRQVIWKRTKSKNVLYYVFFSCLLRRGTTDYSASVFAFLERLQKVRERHLLKRELKLRTNKQRSIDKQINRSRSCSVSTTAVIQIFKASFVGVFQKSAGSLKHVHSTALFSTPRPFSFLCRQIKGENQQGEHDIKIRVESAERLSALRWKMAGRDDVKGARWWTHTQAASLLIMY